MADQAELEAMGFVVKTKPKKATGRPLPTKPTKVTMARPVKESVGIKPVPSQEVKVIDNTNHQLVEQQVQMTYAMQDMVSQMVLSMKELGYKPKALKCDSIKRDVRGLMTSFEIKII